VEKNKVDCDLIDLRSIYPIDFSTISSSVKKTGKLLIVEPDIVYAGVGAEIAAQVAERCWDSLEKPLLRLGMPRVTIPATASLHKKLIPSEEQTIASVQRLIK
jgi:pyruvate/2-oxoglutarate/acetoin dehydrogenase E1 component